MDDVWVKWLISSLDEGAVDVIQLRSASVKQSSSYTAAPLDTLRSPPRGPFLLIPQLVCLLCNLLLLDIHTVACGVVDTPVHV